MDNVKNELRETIEFFEGPFPVLSIGAKVPKGVLLVGLQEQERPFLHAPLLGRQECRFLASARPSL